MSSSLIVSQEATKAIDRLDRTTARRIQARLDELARDPYAGRLSKPVVMVPGLRVAQAGEWRLFFLVHDTNREIFITAVYHRKEAYQKMH